MSTENEKMELQEAIELLKTAVKDSHLKDQKHVDLTLVDALERPKYQLALFVAQNAVKNQILSETDLKQQIGLIEGQ